MAGNRGLGGGRFEAQEAGYDLEKKKILGQDHGGPIVGSRLVEGEQVRGESVATFKKAVAAGAQSAADAVQTNRIPREYHDAVKHYFGRLEAKTKAGAGQTENAGEPGNTGGSGGSAQEGAAAEE